MDFKGLSDPVVIFNKPTKRSIFDKLHPPGTSFFKNKKYLGGALTVFLLFAVGLGVYLAQKPTQLTPRADVAPGVACMQTGLGINQQPVTAANSKKPGTNLVFWNQSVNRQAFLQKATDCSVEILNPANFTPSEIKQLVQSVTGVPSGSSDNSKYRNIIIEGPCTDQKLTQYQNAGNTILVDSQCDESGIDLKVNIFYGPGSGANPFGIYTGIADEGDNGYPLIVVSNIIPSPSPSPTPSGDPASCTSSSQCSQGKTCFNYQSYPGTCRPSDTVCIQVLTPACNLENSTECVDFPNPCVVPPGWSTSKHSPTPSPTANSSPSPSAIPCQSNDQCAAGYYCQVIDGACTNSVPGSCTIFQECRPNTMPLPGAKGDGNSDSIIDLTDLSILLTKWSPAITITSHFQLDFNDDGKINSFDHAQMNQLLLTRGVIRQ